ncbi:major facilitator superfamily domain-containing protein 10 isoform X4 [Corythoichthys intestinalis]|uniref:major facilitator superfamily domain-containing protein 10 isoform X4 n=1 Tax=Corythoichthys intestinalis TaxID=161448 RepID=UPI0025A4CF4E|nr:major facilitator superfamily domain-containing protein 10 isoform X4 [Corythoichthys intestinalis]
MSAERKAAPSSSRVIFVVFILLLLDLLGFTLILPLLPSILDHYAHTEDAVYQTLQSSVDVFREALGIPMEKKFNSVLFGGLMGSVFSLLQFLASPITGALSDRYGRRPLLLLTTAAIGVAFSVGFTAGPLMGAYLSSGSQSTRHLFFQTPALLSLAFSVADLLFIWLMLPETLSMNAKASHSGFGDFRDLLSPLALFNFSAVTRSKAPPSEQKMRRLKLLGHVYFCYLFLFSGLEFTLSFLTHQRFHFTSMQQGKMFFFIGVTMASIQGGYARRIKPGHHVKAVRMAIAALIPAFILIGISWNVTMLYVGLALYSFAAAVVVPCLSTLVSDHGSASQKGTVMGILRSLGALARALGPVTSSSVYWLAGAQTCFLVTSASFLVPLILLSTA